MGSSSQNASTFVKGVLALQALVILGLSIWMYKEYTSNSYLQSYLATILQGTGPAIAVMGLGGLVATVLVGILLKAGNILGEIDQISEKAEDRRETPHAGPASVPTMPVLKVVEAEPKDEIGRLHRSMQRWNERSKFQE
jgi:hypothetical protein